MPESIDSICRLVATAQPDTLKACNFYLRAVFARLFDAKSPELRLVDGDANSIVARFSRLPFNSLGHNFHAAVSRASTGDLVFGGLRDAGQGHVFIVQSTGLSKAGLPMPWVNKETGKPILSRGGMPRLFNGSTNEEIPTPESSVDIIFKHSDQAKVVYAWLPYAAIRSTGKQQKMPNPRPGPPGT
jgi:hypothetical protein